MNTIEYLRMEGREEGVEIGKEQATTAIIENLLKQSDFSAEKIASVANVTVDFVNGIKKELESAI